MLCNKTVELSANLLRKWKLIIASCAKLSMIKSCRATKMRTVVTHRPLLHSSRRTIFVISWPFIYSEVIMKLVISLWPSNWCASNHDFDLDKERTIKAKNHDDHWPYMLLQRVPETKLAISIIRYFVKRKSLFLSPSYKCLSFSFPNNFLHTHSSAFECFFFGCFTTFASL